MPGMDKEAIESYTYFVRYTIAVNQALLKHGAHTTFDNILDELDTLWLMDITPFDVAHIIQHNLENYAELVNTNIAHLYVEAAIGIYTLQMKDPVKHLLYLASDEYDTNEEFLYIESEILKPLGGPVVDYEDYKKAARTIVESITE